MHHRICYSSSCNTLILLHPKYKGSKIEPLQQLACLLKMQNVNSHVHSYPSIKTSDSMVFIDGLGCTDYIIFGIEQATLEDTT